MMPVAKRPIFLNIIRENRQINWLTVLFWTSISFQVFLSLLLSWVKRNVSIRDHCGQGLPAKLRYLNVEPIVLSISSYTGAVSVAIAYSDIKQTPLSRVEIVVLTP